MRLEYAGKDTSTKGTADSREPRATCRGSSLGIILFCSFLGLAVPRVEAQVQVPWDQLGTTVEVGRGITPGIATDSQGDIHVVFMGNGKIFYRRGSAAGQFGDVEEIPQPDGSGSYNSPHIQVDANDVPHVVFKKDSFSSSKKAWYTNRTGGSWRAPIVAIDNPNSRVNYPRLALNGSTAIVAAFGSDGSSTQ